MVIRWTRAATRSSTHQRRNDYSVNLSNRFCFQYGRLSAPLPVPQVLPRVSDKITARVDSWILATLVLKTR